MESSDPHLSFTRGESLLNSSTPPLEIKYPVDLFLIGHRDSELLAEKSKLSFIWCDGVYGYVYVFTFYIFTYITSEMEKVLTYSRHSKSVSQIFITQVGIWKIKLL